MEPTSSRVSRGGLGSVNDPILVRPARSASPVTPHGAGEARAAQGVVFGSGQRWVPYSHGVTPSSSRTPIAHAMRFTRL